MNTDLEQRITFNSRQCGAHPCIRGMRVRVADVLEMLAQKGMMAAYKHSGFWKPMDTLRDNVELNEMWDKNTAPWKVW